MKTFVTVSWFASLSLLFSLFISVSLLSLSNKSKMSSNNICFFLSIILLDGLFEEPPHHCCPDLMKSHSSVSVGLWVCVSVCVHVRACVHSCACSQLSHFRNQLYFLWFGGDILTWSGRWCEVNLLLLFCHVAAARNKTSGSISWAAKVSGLLSQAKKKTLPESNVKVKWLPAGKSFSLKCCKMTCLFFSSRR